MRGGAAFEHAGCESAAFGLGHTKGRFLVCACIIYKERERAPSKRSDACTHQPTRQSPLSLGLELELPLGLELRSACIQTRSLGGSVEYTHNGVSIGWHIAKKPGLKTFVVQRAAHSIKEGGCSWMCAGNALPGAPRLMPVGSHVFANSEYTVFRT